MRLPFQTKAAITSSEITPALTMKPFALLNLLQNVADLAVAKLRLTMTDMVRLGCAWMVYDYRIRLTAPLMGGQDVTVSTGHSPWRDLYSIRLFDFRDAQGNLLGQASSRWILTDLQSRRPQRLSRRLGIQYFESADIFESADFEKLTPPQRIDSRYSTAVRLGDLDMNGHVNNAHFLSWIGESVPPELFLHSGLVGVKLQFLHEALQGADVTVESQRDGLLFSHQVLDREGRVLALAETQWQEV